MFGCAGSNIPRPTIEESLTDQYYRGMRDAAVVVCDTLLVSLQRDMKNAGAGYDSIMISDTISRLRGGTPFPANKSHLWMMVALNKNIKQDRERMGIRRDILRFKMSDGAKVVKTEIADSTMVVTIPKIMLRQLRADIDWEKEVKKVLKSGWDKYVSYSGISENGLIAFGAGSAWTTQPPLMAMKEAEALRKAREQAAHGKFIAWEESHTSADVEVYDDERRGRVYKHIYDTLVVVPRIFF